MTHVINARRRNSPLQSQYHCAFEMNYMQYYLYMCTTDLMLHLLWDWNHTMTFQHGQETQCYGACMYFICIVQNTRAIAIAPFCSMFFLQRCKIWTNCVWSRVQKTSLVIRASLEKKSIKSSPLVYILPLTNIFQRSYFVKFGGKSPLTPEYF